MGNKLLYSSSPEVEPKRRFKSQADWRYRAPLIVLSLTVVVAALANQYDSLVENSPFGKAPSANSSPDSEPPLEFRGLFVEGGELHVSVYDRSTRRSSWVGLNETVGSMVVKSYDAAKCEIIVEQSGRIISVGLKEAKVLAMPTSRPIKASTESASITGQIPVMAQVASSEEAAHLAQIAAEIRRRRAARIQAAQRTSATEDPQANLSEPARSATP